MLKSELNAYLAAVKPAKSKSLPILNGVAITGEQIISTDLTSMVVLNLATTTPPAVYDNSALDVLKIDTNADLTQYQTAKLDCFPELKDVEWEDSIDLNTKVGENDFGTLLVKSSKLCHKDRSPLDRVWLIDGEVMATDGYVLHMSGKLDFLATLPAVNISPRLISIYNKLKKYGEWQIVIGNTMFKGCLDTYYVKLTNGVIELIEASKDLQFPECRRVVNRHYNYKVEIPYKQLATLGKDEIAITLDGKFIVDGKIAPISATIIEEEKAYDKYAARTVIMGKEKEIAPIVLDTQLVKKFGLDTLTLRFEKTTEGVGKMCGVE